MINVEGKGTLMNRLQSAEGHLASVIKMIEADQPAEDVLRQLSAVQAALNKINALVFNQEIEIFFQKIRNNASEQERYQEAQKVLKIYGTIQHKH